MVAAFASLDKMHSLSRPDRSPDPIKQGAVVSDSSQSDSSRSHSSQPVSDQSDASQSATNESGAALAQNANPTLRWFQARAYLLFALVVVMAMAASFVGRNLYLAGRQRKAAEAIGELEGRALYEFQHPSVREPPTPKWLRNLFGDDFFFSVVTVDLNGTATTDEDLPMLDDFPKLRWLMLDRTQVSDELIPRIKKLKGLAQLHLRDTAITEEGLSELRSALPRTQIWPMPANPPQP